MISLSFEILSEEDELLSYEYVVKTMDLSRLEIYYKQPPGFQIFYFINQLNNTAGLIDFLVVYLQPRSKQGDEQ